MRQGRKLEVEENARIDNIEDANEKIIVNDELRTAINDNLNEETVTISDASQDEVILPPFKWAPEATTKKLRWSL